MASRKPTLSFDVFLLESRKNRHTTRIGLAAAALAHVLLFAVNWPISASSAPDVPRKTRVYRIPCGIGSTSMTLPPPAPFPKAPKHICGFYPSDPDPVVVAHELHDLEEPDWEGLFEPSGAANPLPVQSPHITTPLPVGAVVPPRKIHHVDARFPEIARRAGIRGTVILELTIGSDGHVKSVNVIRGLPFGVTEAAVEAAHQWVFEIPIHNGQPVGVRHIVKVPINLEE